MKRFSGAEDFSYPFFSHRKRDRAGLTKRIARQVLGGDGLVKYFSFRIRCGQGDDINGSLEFSKSAGALSKFDLLGSSHRRRLQWSPESKPDCLRQPAGRI